jgi:hypothetical protein
LRRSAAIIVCPQCGCWNWESIDYAGRVCCECSADLAGIPADRQAGLDALHCEMFHIANEEPERSCR